MLQTLEIKRSKCGTFKCGNIDYFCNKSNEANKKSHIVTLFNAKETCHFHNPCICYLMKKRFKRLARRCSLKSLSESFTNHDTSLASDFYTARVELRTLIRGQMRTGKLDFVGALLRRCLNKKKQKPHESFFYVLCSQFLQLMVNGEYEGAILFARKKMYSMLRWEPISSKVSSISHLDVSPIFEIMKIIGPKDVRLNKFDQSVDNLMKNQQCRQEGRPIVVKISNDLSTRNYVEVGRKYDDGVGDTFSDDLNLHGNLYVLSSVMVKKHGANISLLFFAELCLALLSKCNMCTGKELVQKLRCVLHQLSDLLNHFFRSLPGEDFICLRRYVCANFSDSQLREYIYFGSYNSRSELHEDVDIISLCVRNFFWSKHAEWEYDACESLHNYN